MNKKSQDYDYIIKLVFVGASGAGKTSLLTRITEDKFQQQYLATIGVDFRIKTTNIDGYIVKSQMWDTAGQERFRTIVSSSYYRGAAGIFLTFDTTSEESFYEAQKIMESIKGIVEDDVPKVLVGCKVDLEEQRAIVYDVAQALANDLGIYYIETSAKTGYNCSTIHDTLSKLALSYLLSKNNQVQPKDNEKNKQINEKDHKKKNIVVDLIYKIFHHQQIYDLFYIFQLSIYPCIFMKQQVLYNRGPVFDNNKFQTILFLYSIRNSDQNLNYASILIQIMDQKTKNQTQKFHYEVKLIVFGRKNSGKVLDFYQLETSFLKRISENSFYERKNSIHLPSDIHFMTIQIGDSIVKTTMWDNIPTKSQTHQISKLYCRNADGIFFMFDTTDQESFNEIPKLMKEIEQLCSDEIPKILVGCKNDLEEQKIISYDIAQAFANDNGLYYIETSSKTGYNCSNAYYYLSQLALGYYIKNYEKRLQQFTLRDQSREPQRYPCC